MRATRVPEEMRLKIKMSFWWLSSSFWLRRKNRRFVDKTVKVPKGESNAPSL